MSDERGKLQSTSTTSTNRVKKNRYGIYGSTYKNRPRFGNNPPEFLSDLYDTLKLTGDPYLVDERCPKPKVFNPSMVKNSKSRLFRSRFQDRKDKVVDDANVPKPLDTNQPTDSGCACSLCGQGGNEELKEEEEEEDEDEEIPEGHFIY